MSLKGKTIGLAVTGSFCTFDKIKQTVQTLIQEEAELYPIFSSHVQTTRSRFGSTDEYIRTISGLAGREPILTIEDAEPIGPKGYLDLLLIAPCTGNTLAKLANGITDTPVLMAAKAHLRNEKPLVIFLSTNDAMGMNFKNTGTIPLQTCIFCSIFPGFTAKKALFPGCENRACNSNHKSCSEG